MPIEHSTPYTWVYVAVRFKDGLVLTFSSQTNYKSNLYTGMDRPLGLQQAEASRISRQSVHEGGKFVSPTHRPPLPPSQEISLVLISVRDSVDHRTIVQLE